VALLVVLALTIPAQLYLAIPLAPVLAARFAVGVDAAVWAGSGFAIAYAVGFLVLGPLAEQVGHRAVLAWGAVATALTTAAAALSPTWSVLLACRVAQGFAAAAFAPAALALVAARTPAARRHTTLTAVTGGLLAAGVLGQAVGAWAAAFDQWRPPLWGGAACYAAAAVGLWVLLPADDQTSRPPWRRILATMRGLCSRWPTLAVFLAATSVFGSFVGLYTVLGPHVAAQWRLAPAGQVGVRAVGIVGLVVAPLVAARLARAGARRPPVVGFLLAAAGALITVSGSAVPVIALGGSVVFVAGIGLTVPGLVGLLHGVAGPEAGVAISVNTCALFLGAAFWQPVAAALGFAPTLIALALVLCAAGALVASSAPSGGAVR
jgi:predicted MFS family arabinose efflux permease